MGRQCFLQSELNGMGVLHPYSSAPWLPCRVFVFSSALMSLFVVGHAWSLCLKTMRPSFFFFSQQKCGRSGQASSTVATLQQLSLANYNCKSSQPTRQAGSWVNNHFCLHLRRALVMPVPRSIPSTCKQEATATWRCFRKCMVQFLGTTALQLSQQKRM